MYVRNSIKKVWELGMIFDRQNPMREPRTYILIKVARYYKAGEHLKPRNNNIQREANKYFESPIRPFTPMLSTVDTPSVSTAKPSNAFTAETSVRWFKQ